MLPIRGKLEKVYDKYQELEKELSKPEIVSDRKKFSSISQEYSHLKKIAEKYKEWDKVDKEIADQKEMLSSEKDHDLIEMIKEEIPELEKQFERLTEEIQVLLLPQDPIDAKGAILEIRAGTGGSEAALFAEEIYRMYTRFSEQKKWKIEQLSISLSEGGGLKEVVASIQGVDVYGTLKYEGGVHRVQRVPATESQGRIHTSAVTVAVLPEAEDIDAVEMDEKELKIDVYRASGAGGQHVNTTDSAVRITHLPTGLVVAMQDERSQIQNRVKAMKILTSKLLQLRREEQQSEVDSKRRSLVGSGDRSEKIRTYNFPQGRVTDHRVPVTLYRLTETLAGDLTLLLEPVIMWHNAELLKLDSE
ncbi:peptide chain release factor 1 [bacterium]|nr:peptide chain release factor 1 [bacterium]